MLIVALLAQAAAAVAPASGPAPQAAPEAAPQTQGVTSYPAAFFAPFNSNNAYEMVGHIPGFTLDTGASVRGFEGAAGNVLIDGQRPASKSDSIDQVLQRITAGQVERIDLIRGGAPGIDMQGKTVLANVVRKKTGGLRGLAAVAAGYYPDTGRTTPTVRFEASNGSAGRSWEASLRAGQGIDDSSGPGPEIKVDPNGHVISQNHVSADGGGNQATAAGSFELPVLGGQVRVNGRYYLNRFDYHETDSFLVPPGLENRDHTSDDEDDTEIGVRFSRAFAPRTNLELVGLRTSKDETLTDVFTQHPGPEDKFGLDRYSTEGIGRGVLKFRWSDSMSLEAGGEAALNKLDSKTRLSEDGAPLPLPAANVRVEEKRWEAFAKAIVRPFRKITVEAQVRQEGSHISSAGDVVLSKHLSFTKPRIAVTWDATANDQVRLRYEREVGQLNFDDFVASSSLNTSTVTAGNPNLNPEQAWVSEAALEHRFWGAGALTLTYRHYDVKDVIDRAPVFTATGFFDQPSNIGDGTKDEYAVDLTLPLDRAGLKGAQLKGSLTRRDTEVTDPTTHGQREVSKLHPLDWEAHFSQPLTSWNANWGLDAFGGWRRTYYRADVIDDQKLKTFVAAYFEWKPRPDIQLHAELDNLTGRGYRDTRNVYAGPRGTAPLSYVDDRDLQFGQYAFFRIRKYFGG